MKRMEQSKLMLRMVLLFILLIPAILPVHATDEDITSGLICPCECAMVISTCDCPTAIQIKKEIIQMKNDGFSEKQVFSALQAEYGRGILAHPEKPVPLWIAGIPLTLILMFIGYMMTRKPNPDIIPDKKRYEQRFEEEYRKFVSEMEEP
ncbi:putative cytochrome biosynthesis protein [Candidatus Methanoperedens nitroreducens]|uniref:Putative cytochrome biosynthesis protein n=1 Tax=Candidatus Methanoperedens nitratireducens TaxID=1392998 RepID=A0A062VAQ2_9EURY|nr:cytochrome c-type biogenesis protein CcmH [Candidatus Methanoperedens nitroreducens]KCZ72400.1 putative cytochrome biosynthesis protein [Candidatus Methanoperedens nitroreducens]MDJ1423666.1 cytochrome c-type biogenesis protein CcmH [Candidatus Methanoperedens sp.]